MRIPRFHIDIRLNPDMEVVLPSQAAAHAARVLRLAVGDRVTLFNGDGNEYPARLSAINPREVSARVESRRAVASESPLRITLAQALARGEKMDWIVQKATELGVAAIVPLVTERSEVRLDEKRAAKRVEHWHAVAVAACEQSGRCIIPAIEPPQPLQTWLASMPAQDDAVSLVLHPEDGSPARELSPVPRSLTLVVGPEGGLGERDLATLHDAGFKNLSLGPRILRTETAGLAAISALQAIFGDL